MIFKLLKTILVPFFHRVLKIIVLLLPLLTCTSAGIFQCVFNMTTIGAIGEVYSCDATWMDQGDQSQNLSNVTGNHMNGMSFIDVRHLNVENNPDFIPKGIKLFFPDLQSLRWFRTNLDAISKDDLEPFPKLEVLYFPVNQIYVLGGDLFSVTPNLRWISFVQNQIGQVGRGLLTNLPDLDRAFFNDNPCIDDYALGREAIMKLNDILPTACPYVATTTTSTTSTTTVPTTTTATTTESSTNSPNECSEACLTRIEVSEREISILHDEVSKLHVTNDRLNAENEAQSSQIASLNDEVLQLRTFSEALAAKVEEIEKQLRELPSSPHSWIKSGNEILLCTDKGR